MKEIGRVIGKWECVNLDDNLEERFIRREDEGKKSEIGRVKGKWECGNSEKS